MAEHPDGAAAHIRAFIGADIVEKAAVDGLESSPAHPHGPAAVKFGFSGGIAIGKGDVLYRQSRMILVLAMRGGPDLIRIAGVHVQNAGSPPSAERHQAAAIDDDVGVGIVEHLGRSWECYRDRIRTAVEYNGPPLGDGIDKGFSAATLWRSVADNLIGGCYLFEVRFGGYRCGTGRIAGRWATIRIDGWEMAGLN